MPVILTKDDGDCRILSCSADQADELFHAAKALYSATTECRHGFWQVSNASLRRLLKAVDAIDPAWDVDRKEAFDASKDKTD